MSQSPKKIRYDLVPQNGLEEVHKILNDKLNKYHENQWKKGLKWSEVLSNLKRHLSEFEKGNDFTDEGFLQLGEVAMNALILCEYFSIYPQGDDRLLTMQDKPIICCDLDDVIFDFRGAYEKRFNTKLSDYWNGDYNMNDNLKELQNDKEFWVNLPLKSSVPFEIDYYVTARSIPVEWTLEAIQRNNLPKAKIYSLQWNESKIDTLKSLKTGIMIDDKFTTFKECEANGIFCYLVESPTNIHYKNLGHRRIKSLEQLTNLK